MTELVNTGILDKTGRSIFVDDVVQHRLGKFGKSGGSKNFKVILYGKKYHLVEESRIDYKYGGMQLTQKLSENLVVIKSSHIRG